MVSPPALKSAAFRLGLPPSLGKDQARDRAVRLEQFLEQALGRRTEVMVAQTYEQLAKDALAGRIDAAWAPPFVCARLESMGSRTLARGVRKGASSYRSALVCQKERALTVEGLKGLTAAWVDRDSVAGYLLPMALLKARGLDPAKTFFAQEFAGSYRASLEKLLAGGADVAAVFAPSAASRNAGQTGAEEILQGSAAKLHVIGFSEESPNDGVILSPSIDPAALVALERTLLTLDSAPGGRELLADVFSVDRFEPAPRLGYRALYRVALASL